MYKQFILLLAMFLCTTVASAQTLASQGVSAQEHIATTSTMLRTVPFLRLTNPGKTAIHFSYPVRGSYGRGSGLEDLESLSSMREVKTLFTTRSSLPLVHLWGGRLRLDGFTSTLDMQNVQLGPAGGGNLQDFRLRRQNYPGEPRLVTLDGVSLTFHLGRDARTGRPVQLWRCLARIINAVR
jgi:hypothetical protein